MMSSLWALSYLRKGFEDENCGMHGVEMASAACAVYRPVAHLYVVSWLAQACTHGIVLAVLCC